ncbi:MAG: quinolinate synthase NadA [Victivallaceae bacterium]|nr:quinolinate synthase NadA [Victivallaceae bacterium]
MMTEIQKRALELKQERGAIILAHNYVDESLPGIADLCGDSLELSMKASKTNAKVIVVCGVRFMAETVKLLSPDATVLLPCSDAGCPMADMADGTMVEKARSEHPDAIAMAYVNTTAETKAHVDICCTSGNAERVVSSIPSDKKIIFLPDANLGSNVSHKLGRNVIPWKGCCPIHDKVTAEMIENNRRMHPGAVVMVHPECRPETVAAADVALSTGAMLKFVRESNAKEFIVGTESGIIPRLIRENPGKTFHPLLPELVCADMKKITVEQVVESLRNDTEAIVVPDDVASKALESVRRMLAL